LFSWWRAAQFRDIPGAAALFADGVNTKGLEGDLAALSPPLAASRPAIIDVVEEGGAATIYAIVQTIPLRGSTGRVGAGGNRAVESPATFSMVKEGEEWKLADNRYLEQRVRAQEQAGSRSQQNPGQGESE
jgi:hypothetical protein